MTRQYCDRCGCEVVIKMEYFDPYNGTVTPTVKLIRNGTRDGEPIAIRKTFDLCETCFDNVLAYTTESKV